MSRRWTQMLGAMVVAAAGLVQARAAEAGADKAPQLNLGDPAPRLQVGQWLQGEPVAALASGTVYVVEFWATWCGPCRASMPHLTSLQKDYKDYGVTFVSISDEPLETVTKFLDSTDKASGKKWNDIIGYTLTTDPDKSVKADYFTAAGRTGIPSAFIVGKDGRIEWIGNPHPEADDGFDKALDAVVKGTWDREAFAAQAKKKASAEREMMAQQQALMKAMQNQDHAKVLEIVDPMLAKDPKNPSAGMMKFQTLLVGMNKPDEAYAFARQFTEGQRDNAMLLNQFAWTIVDDPGVKKRDLDLALEFATQANKGSGGNNPAILDTLARCYYETHDLTNAIKYQEQAAAKAGDDETGADIKKTLDKYRQEAAKKGR